MVIPLAHVEQILAVPNAHALIRVHVKGVGKIRHDKLARDFIKARKAVPLSGPGKGDVPLLGKDHLVFPVGEKNIQVCVDAFHATPVRVVHRSVETTDLTLEVD